MFQDLSLLLLQEPSQEVRGQWEVEVTCPLLTHTEACLQLVKVSPRGSIYALKNIYACVLSFYSTPGRGVNINKKDGSLFSVMKGS